MSNALGIDLGSGKVAVVLTDEQGVTIDAVSMMLPQKNYDEIVMEIDPKDIFDTLDFAIKNLNDVARREVDCIGVCGQMHGVVLWNDLKLDHCNLITWQDKRADEDNFIYELRKKTGLSNIYGGYGIVSLAWMKERNPNLLNEFDYAGTIMDYLVSKCCDKVEPIMDYTNAAGWGFFDNERLDWDMTAFEKTGLSKKILPKLTAMGTFIGELCPQMADEWGIRKSAKVAVACGDSQATILSSKQPWHNSIFINVGTGSQLTVVVDKSRLDGMEKELGMDVRPFVNDKFLVVVTAVCGGKSFQWLVETVETWLEQLGIDAPSKDSIYKTINRLGENCEERQLPKFLPYFREERHVPGEYGSISGIRWNNMSLASVAKAMAFGMIESLWNRMPAQLTKKREKLVATGNGIKRSSLLRKVVKEITEMELILSDSIEDAANGAAAMALQLQQRQQKDTT